MGIANAGPRRSTHRSRSVHGAGLLAGMLREVCLVLFDFLNIARGLRVFFHAAVQRRLGSADRAGAGPQLFSIWRRRRLSRPGKWAVFAMHGWWSATRQLAGTRRGQP